MLCKSIDELFAKGSGVEESALKGLMQKVRCNIHNQFKPSVPLVFKNLVCFAVEVFESS